MANRAVARAGRGGDPRGDLAVRGFVGGKIAGQGQGPDRPAIRDHLQRQTIEPEQHRHARRIRLRGPLPGVAAAVGPAPDHRGPFPSGDRSHGPVDRTLPGRMHLSRDASGRKELRRVSCERLRGGGAPRDSILGVRPHAAAGARRRHYRRTLPPTAGSKPREAPWDPPKCPGSNTTRNIRIPWICASIRKRNNER